MAVLSHKFHLLLKKVSLKNVDRDRGDVYEKLLESEEQKRSNSSSTTTTRGSFPIYVGEDRKRYMVPTAVANSPPFVAMLDQYQDEISRSGPLTLPCSAAAFELVLRRAHEQATVHNKKYVDDDSSSTLSYCCDSSTHTGIFYYHYFL